MWSKENFNSKIRNLKSAFPGTLESYLKRSVQWLRMIVERGEIY
jgi:hypothetical protein